MSNETDKQQPVDPGSLQRLGSTITRECQCVTWCDDGPEIRMLTGHHEYCNCVTKSGVRESYRRLVTELVRGIEAIAADCGEHHPGAWDAYKKAKCVIGEFRNVMEPESATDQADPRRNEDSE